MVCHAPHLPFLWIRTCTTSVLASVPDVHVAPTTARSRWTCCGRVSDPDRMPRGRPEPPSSPSAALCGATRTREDLTGCGPACDVPGNGPTVATDVATSAPVRATDGRSGRRSRDGTVMTGL